MFNTHFVKKSFFPPLLYAHVDKNLHWYGVQWVRRPDGYHLYHFVYNFLIGVTRAPIYIYIINCTQIMHFVKEQKQVFVTGWVWVNDLQMVRTTLF